MEDNTNKPLEEELKKLSPDDLGCNFCENQEGCPHCAITPTRAELAKTLGTGWSLSAKERIISRT